MDRQVVEQGFEQAPFRDVRRIILRQGLTLVGMGVVLGIGAALLASRALSSLLYGLSPADPVSFVVASVALVAAAAAASYLPAYRASRVDPLVSLRHV